MSGQAPQQGYLAETRVLSGMRASGSLHLGHYFGALKNWVAMQQEYQCFYFVADWHGLTTHYASPDLVKTSALEMVVDWLAAGIDPERSTIFRQSQLPQHAELHLLLSMLTPLSWLERIPSYKEQRANIKDRDLATYGFLGYPLLQSADILLYRAAWVPVGEDQSAHVEFAREVARRFNRLYGSSGAMTRRRDTLLLQMPTARRLTLIKQRQAYLEQGDREAYHAARKGLIEARYDEDDLLILLGYLDDTGKIIMPLPQALVSASAKMPGLDGRKMSKSYGNTILLRDDTDSIAKKLKVMPTDPARVRRSDKGNPEKCPVWEWHKVYSSTSTLRWVDEGCRSAGIGCVECKQRLTAKVVEQQRPFLERVKMYRKDKGEVLNVLKRGRDKAAEEAEKTMRQVRSLMGV